MKIEIYKFYTNRLKLSDRQEFDNYFKYWLKNKKSLYKTRWKLIYILTGILIIDFIIFAIGSKISFSEIILPVIFYSFLSGLILIILILPRDIDQYKYGWYMFLKSKGYLDIKLNQNDFDWKKNDLKHYILDYFSQEYSWKK